MQLRFATVGAAEGWAEVQRAVSPYVVTSEEAVLHEMEHHPATLARDARVLVEQHGFTLRQARVFDMFPHTHHIESLALFTRDEP